MAMVQSGADKSVLAPRKETSVAGALVFAQPLPPLVVTTSAAQTDLATAWNDGFNRCNSNGASFILQARGCNVQFVFLKSGASTPSIVFNATTGVGPTLRNGESIEVTVDDRATMIEYVGDTTGTLLVWPCGKA